MLLIFLLGAVTSLGQASQVLLIEPLVDVVLFPPDAGLEDGGDSGLEDGDGEGNVVSRAMLAFSGRVEANLVPAADHRLVVLLAIVIVAGAIALVSTAAQYVFSLLSRRVSYRMVVDLRMELARHLVGLSLRYHGQRRFGDLLSRISGDVNKTLDAVLRSISGLLRDPLEAVAFLVVAAVIAWKPTVALLVAVPIIVVPVQILGRKIRKRSTQSLESLGNSVQVLTQMFQGIRTVKAFRSEDRELDRYRDINESYFAKSMRMVRSMALADAWGVLFSIGGAALAMGLVGLAHVTWGIFTDNGAMLGFFIAMSTALQRMRHMTRVMTELEEAVGASSRLSALLEEQVDVALAEHPIPLTGLGTGIRMQGVSFTHPEGERPAIRDLDLEIRPGETLAIVGPSAAGKSTFVDLLCRFVDPDAGRITVDGIDLRQASLDDWTSLYALVDQTPFLFHASIAENLRYARPEATDAELEVAARAAQIHSTIAGLPAGYATNVADQGTRLSGGQLQRITIARALLRDAPLLILDEATSNLDAETEKRVQQALDALMEQRTVIIIAHRLVTIQDADRIAVLDQGRLVELGTHEELIHRQGVYARLCALQKIETTPPPGRVEDAG